MRSHELAEILLASPDCELIMQKDGEGNGYSPLAGVEMDVIYVAESTYSGTVYSTEYTAEENGMEEDEWEELVRTKSGYAVLFPLN